MTAHDDTTTTRLLRDLDAADRELSPSQRARAARTLSQILATDPQQARPVPTPPLARSRRRRAVLLAGGVACAIAAVVAVPAVTGGGDAFATWSATPVELRGAERAAALRACVSLQSGDVGELALDPGAEGSALIAEARGGWSYVVFTAGGVSGVELQGSCLVPDDVLADPRPGGGGFFGGLAAADDATTQPPAADTIREDVSGVGSVEDEMFVYAEGRAGRDVVSIHVTTPSGVRVEASVDRGRWAVWWPAVGDTGRSADVREAPEYEITLRDGTVRATLAP